jgi:nicotinic acid phosphoribosyltransferase
MFKPNPLGITDGYKIGHRDMLAPNTDFLYGTWIPRSLKHASPGISKVLSAGHQLTWRWLHDTFQEYFFNETIEVAKSFGRDMSKYLGIPYNSKHFEDLHKLGYLPIKVKALPEGIETYPNVPHQTFVNTLPGFAWLTLYLETPVSNLSWKTPTNATIALQYRRNATKSVMKTDPDNAWFIDWACHDFASRGLDPFTSISSGLAHAMSFTGSDTLVVIDGVRYFYGLSPNYKKVSDGVWTSIYTDNSSINYYGYFRVEEGEITGIGLENSREGGWIWTSGQDNLESSIGELREWPNLYDLALNALNQSQVSIGSVNASEHSVTCTGLFYFLDKLQNGELDHEIDEYYSFDIPNTKSTRENPDLMAIAEWLNLRRWLDIFPVGILSVVSDTFDLFRVVTEILPRLKDKIMSRDGKLVIRPDSGDPVDITCGKNTGHLGTNPWYDSDKLEITDKGVVELLWDIFGGVVNKEGYKVLDPHIGMIYGDSITLTRQVQIYERLEVKGFASTNVVLGVGSYTYQFNTRDTMGFAAKGAWFQTEDKEYNIYKDPVTDDGSKKSLKGLVRVNINEVGEYVVSTEVSKEDEEGGLLQLIYKDGKFYNHITFSEIRDRVRELSMI